MIYVGIMAAFFAGFMSGTYMRGLSFDSLDWSIMKWDTSVLGYRPVKIGTRIMRNDKVVITLHLDTDSYPKEGVKYTDNSLNG